MAGTRKTRDAWADLASKFEASGKTTTVFCKEQRISATTFKWWRWRLRSEKRRVGPDVRLIAVDVKPSVRPTPTAVTTEDVVRISLLDLDIFFEVGTDVGYVSLLVENLRSRC